MGFPSGGQVANTLHLNTGGLPDPGQGVRQQTEFTQAPKITQMTTKIKGSMLQPWCSQVNTHTNIKKTRTWTLHNND